MIHRVYRKPCRVNHAFERSSILARNIGAGKSALLGGGIAEGT
jgi:hypothetical protein